MSKLNLEEAAKKYVASIIYEHGLYDGDFLMPVCEDIFKAGAEWREEQMMKNAVECSVYAGKEGDKWIVSYIGNYESMLKTCKGGDKVRVIIVKE